MMNQRNAKSEYSSFVQAIPHNGVKPWFDAYCNFEQSFKDMIEYDRRRDEYGNSDGKKVKKSISENRKSRFEIQSKLTSTNNQEDEFKEFQNGLEYPKKHEELKNILTKTYKGQLQPPLPIKDRFKFKIYDFDFDPPQKQQFVKFVFDENLFLNTSAVNTEKWQESHKSRRVRSAAVAENTKLMFNFKTDNARTYYKFLSYINDDWLLGPKDNPDGSKEVQNDIIYQEKLEKILQIYRIQEEEYKPFEEKIALHKCENMNDRELTIFDKIWYDPKKPSRIDTKVFECQVVKRSEILCHSRYNLINGVTRKWISFLNRILVLIEKKKENFNVKQISNEGSKANIKSKFKEIKSTNIITFSDVNQFMKSKFGNYDMVAFNKWYKEKVKQNEEKKKLERLNELKRKMKETLFQKEEEDPDNENGDKMYNEAWNNDLMNDPSIWKRCAYRPRKKVNNWEGMTNFIKEESGKK